MLDLLRQVDLFKPGKFKDKIIDVIGVGASGSYIVWLLSKVGLSNIRIWDFDTIEGHNISNQCFMLKHIGKSKVEAMKEMVKEGADIEIQGFEKKVEDSQELGHIVFLLVDSMSMRKVIWNNLLKHKLNIECMIETRMSASSGRVYLIHPYDPNHVKNWEETLCDDSEAEVSSCGASISIATTASLVASIAVWQLIKWLKQEEVENELLISGCPWTMITRTF